MTPLKAIREALIWYDNDEDLRDPDEFMELLRVALQEAEQDQATCEHVYGTIHGQITTSQQDIATFGSSSSWFQFCPECRKELR